MRVRTRLAAKVLQGGGRWRGHGGILAERLLGERLKRSQVAAGVEHSDVAQIEDRRGVRARIVRGEVVDGDHDSRESRKHGFAEAVGESESVRRPDRLGERGGECGERGEERGERGGECGERLGLTDGRDRLGELVASELCRGLLEGADVNEESPIPGQASRRAEGDEALAL